MYGLPYELTSVYEDVGRPYIREVILENFMSHEYSRISLNSGLNVIVGPNGAGKSSILLAISVALGQSYTERGQKLSDLIRRGMEAARVVVVLDNRPVGGRRPIPSIQSDTVSIARFLKRNGEYWHYVNNKFKTKAEVTNLLSKIGINPDNVLIIMHQNMIEQFVSRDSVEKLIMIEEAVGAAGLRERIKEAEQKLSALLAEEAVIRKTLEDAGAAVDFWREEYQKLTLIKELESRKATLDREYYWSLVREAERSRDKIAEKLKNLNEEVEKLGAEAVEAAREVDRKYRQLIEVIRSPTEGIERFIDELVKSAERLGRASALKEFRESELKDLRYELAAAEKELARRVSEASSKGERNDVGRRPTEVLDEMKALELQLASLGQPAPQAEEMFMLAEAKFREAELRAKQLSENARKALEETEFRKEKWRSFLRSLVQSVEPEYSRILSLVGGSGRIELRNLHDIDKASVEIYVGFRGVEPTLLDAHTQSGGERIVATMAFLLALQKHIKSPFRAVDEFDVHLDPLNRERIIKILTATASQDGEAQYIIITPGRLPYSGEMNVIIVQNVRGRSIVSAAEEMASEKLETR
ncbi:MAG: AAA family ATPase [Candidatus Caldarchaeum sp.]|nr:AAA family ATPase [Candidatus Caldarchaeum sp.]